MKLEDIKELIKFVAKSGATDVELEIDNVKISIKSPPKKRRGEKDEVQTIIAHSAIPEPTMVNSVTETVNPASPPIEDTSNDSKDSSPEKTSKNNNYIEIKSSMIGTFYRRSSPEKDPFVSVGEVINVGDTICVIEAMKLFNEIESDIAGTIIKVLVDDATPVEFDQPLFLIDPS